MSYAYETLLQSIEGRQSEFESLRHLPADVSEALTRSGALRMFTAEPYGGPQLDLGPGLRRLEELGYVDSAVGWCTMVAATTSLQSGFLQPEVAAEIFGDSSAVACGVAEPRGTAQVEGDSLRVSGRWAWGSGAFHADWIGAGCRMESGPPVFVFLRREQVQLIDNWHAMGLRATGSGDFEVEEALVPAAHWIRLGVDRPVVEAPLYRFPMWAALSCGVAAVMLGIARRARAELVELATTKAPVGSRRVLARRGTVQAAVGQAETRLLAARTFFDSAVAQAWKAAEEGEVPVDHRLMMRHAASHAARESLAVVRSLFECAGSSAVYESSALQRLLRDVQVAATHGMVAPRTFELLGRSVLGFDPPPGFP